MWDALHADRPYRAGWPGEKVRECIREQAGKHFDPQVAVAFLAQVSFTPLFAMLRALALVLVWW
jgi:HD-GYP domain-containing protein (c-di-GMP phosphodiesterase class II)